MSARCALLLLLFSLLPCTCVLAQHNEHTSTTTVLTSSTAPLSDTLSLTQQEWLVKWEGSLDYTLEALALVSEEELDFRPTADQMTLREQFLHMATNVYFLTGRYVHAPADFDLAATRGSLDKEATAAVLAETIRTAFDFGATACRALAPGELDEPAPEFFAGPRSKRAVLNLIQDHATHHRAQILVYLRLLGHTPPRYRGW